MPTPSTSKSNDTKVTRLPEAKVAQPKAVSFLESLREQLNIPVNANHLKTTLFGIGTFLLLSILLSLGYLSVETVVDSNGISRKNFRAPYAFDVIHTEETQKRIDAAQLKIDANPIYLPTKPFNKTMQSNLNQLLSQLGEFRQWLKKQKTGQKETPADTQTNSQNGAKNNSQVQASIGPSLLERIKEEILIEDATDATYILEEMIKHPFNDEAWYKIKSATEYTVLERLLPMGITNENYLVDLNTMVEKNLPPRLSRYERRFVGILAKSVLVPNKRINTKEMDQLKKEVAADVEPVVRHYRKGEKIVDEGERITPLSKRALETMGQSVTGINWTACFGVVILSGFFTLLGWVYLHYYDHHKFYTPSYGALVMTTTTLFAGLFVVIFRLASLDDVLYFSPYMFPLVSFTLILSIFIHPRVGIALSTLLAFLLVLTLRADFHLMSVLMFGCYVATYLLNIRGHITDRNQLIFSGLMAGISNMILIIAVTLILDRHHIAGGHMGNLLSDILWGGFSGLFSAILTIGILPLLESMFGLISPYTLIELANHDKPLLRRMQFEAPGTFHHSLMVASLSEAAAEAIEADTLLTRVGSLYHDIGKMKRPLFFIENQAYFGAENPHDKLSPRLSKMVITAHPRDSIEMARHHHLPESLMAFMTEHHGTLTTGYFYNQACQQEGPENVNKDQFRYPGPKPQSRETAIVMMADACESAVRALKNPTLTQIEERIDKIVNDRIEENQLDECPITFKDISVMKETFVRVLRGIQHNRIEYQQTILKELGKKLPEPSRPANLTRIKQASSSNKAERLKDPSTPSSKTPPQKPSSDSASS